MADSICAYFFDVTPSQWDHWVRESVEEIQMRYVFEKSYKYSIVSVVTEDLSTKDSNTIGAGVESAE
jgi:hypothetical protein